MPIVYDSLLIALGVVIPAGILAGPRLYKYQKAKREQRAALEEKRDATLERIAKTLKEVQEDQRELGSNVRCLYSIMLAQLDASEVSLKALHGEHLNGNVDEALKSVQAEQRKIREKLVDKVCADIGEGAD